jgi:hypothetical protein
MEAGHSTTTRSGDIASAIQLIAAKTRKYVTNLNGGIELPVDALAHGGFSDVYKSVYDSRPVAVKVIRRVKLRDVSKVRLRHDALPATTKDNTGVHFRLSPMKYVYGRS